MTAPTGYSRLQIGLHWIIAGLILLQLVINDGMEAAFDDRMHGVAPGQPGWAWFHIAIGITVLALALVRLCLRLWRGAPLPPADNPALITWMGMLNHLTLYLLMFAMPLSGAIAWFGFVEIAAELHEWGRVLLLPLILLHVLGALVEHFVLRQDTLQRMFGTALDQRRKR